jgi:hypothetical protein
MAKNIKMAGVAVVPCHALLPRRILNGTNVRQSESLIEKKASQSGKSQAVDKEAPGNQNNLLGKDFQKFFYKLHTF